MNITNDKMTKDISLESINKNISPESIDPEKAISEAAELTGLDPAAIKLLSYWKSQSAISGNVDFINEIIMRTPEYTYQKYRKLQDARNNSEISVSDNAVRGAGGLRSSSEYSEYEASAAAEISDIINHFLTYNHEVSLSECKNYATARRIFPCTRERLKRIQDELLKSR